MTKQYLFRDLPFFDQGPQAQIFLGELNLLYDEMEVDLTTFEKDNIENLGGGLKSIVWPILVDNICGQKFERFPIGAYGLACENIGGGILTQGYMITLYGYYMNLKRYKFYAQGAPISNGEMLGNVWENDLTMNYLIETNVLLLETLNSYLEGR
jgi:hypothetical protein